MSKLHLGPYTISSWLLVPHSLQKRYSYDPVFAKYRTIQDRTFHRNGILSAEIHRTKCLIEAYGSDEARAIDPICRFNRRKNTDRHDYTC